MMLLRSIKSSPRFQARLFSSQITTFQEERISVEIDSKSKIATVSFNRPKSANGLDLKMFDGIREAGLHIKKDRGVRAVVLQGNGSHFCSGMDFKSMMGSPLSGQRLLDRPDGQLANLAQDVAWVWRTLPVPVVALIHGACYGGGFQIALGADFRFAHPDSKFSVMEARWGLIPDMGGSVFLRELVPIDVAKKLAMTACVLDAEEASKHNLITYHGEDYKESAQKLIDEIISRSPDSVAGSKQLFNTTWTTSDEEALKIETDIQRRLFIPPIANTLAAGSKAFKMPVTLDFRDRMEDWGGRLTIPPTKT